MSIKKLWDYTIETKKGFMLRKRKVYLLLREEKEEFISEKLRKEYIRCYNSEILGLVWKKNLV